MKKFAFAMALCVSASFSPALAQSNTTGTVQGARFIVELVITDTTKGSGTQKIVNLRDITLNGSKLLATVPALEAKLYGATCSVTNSNTVVCTK